MIRILAALAFVFATASAWAEGRVALLIGNNNYGSAPLRNAVNDAKDLGDALKELGFKVIVKENTTRKDMIDAIREFGAALEGADAAFFFYAGHAMQFKDRNYLIPIDIAMGSEEDVTFFALDISQVFDRMDKARTRHNFIVLDACRDNPFASSFKVSNAGLAQMSTPSGTLIAYATSPGSVAADGYGRNGIYTKNILANIRVPDVPVEIMFKRVREGVERETLKRQTPWDSSSLKGDFVFNNTAAAAPRPAAAPTAAPAGPSDVALTIEREFWVTVRDSNRAEDIEAYLEKYPNGNFSRLARNKLETMKPTQVASAEPPVMRNGAPPAAQPAVEHKPLPAASASVPPQPAPSSTAQPAIPSPAAAAEPSKVEKPIVVAIAPVTAPPAKPEQLPGREIAPGIREITFPDGAIYRGGVKGMNLHGKGEYVAKTFRYEGEFADGVKSGQGTYTWDNGNRYEGPFADDRPNGLGKYYFANGDAYSGEVKAGTLTGRGTYVTKSGDTLEGSFIDAKLHGVGTYRYASGDRYEGEVSYGKLQGKGRYFTKDGDRIEAPFVDGRPMGKGVYYFSNGDRYEGDIQGANLTGQGAYYYASGLKYEGEMQQARPQGKGTFWFQDGSHFDGKFENGLARATGELVRPDGSKLPAEIVEGAVKVLN